MRTRIEYGHGRRSANRQGFTQDLVCKQNVPQGRKSYSFPDFSTLGTGGRHMNGEKGYVSSCLQVDIPPPNLTKFYQISSCCFIVEMCWSISHENESPKHRILADNSIGNLYRTPRLKLLTPIPENAQSKTINA